MSDYFSTAEIAKSLGVTPRQVQRLVSQRRIPFVRRGRIIRVPVNAWNEYLNQQAREALDNMDAERIADCG